MPIPDKNESKKHYITRCIPIVINEGTTKDPSQAAAICYSLWQKHHKKAKASTKDSFIDSLSKKIDELTGE